MNDLQHPLGNKILLTYENGLSFYITEPINVIRGIDFILGKYKDPGLYLLTYCSGIPQLVYLEELEFYDVDNNGNLKFMGYLTDNVINRKNNTRGIDFI